MSRRHLVLSAGKYWNPLLVAVADHNFRSSYFDKGSADCQQNSRMTGRLHLKKALPDGTEHVAMAGQGPVQQRDNHQIDAIAALADQMARKAFELEQILPGQPLGGRNDCTGNPIVMKGLLARLVNIGLLVELMFVGQEVSLVLVEELAGGQHVVEMGIPAVAVLEEEQLGVRWGKAGVAAHGFQHLLDHYRHLHRLLSHSNPYCQIEPLPDRLRVSLALPQLLVAPGSSADSWLSDPCLAYLLLYMHWLQNLQEEVVTVRGIATGYRCLGLEYSRLYLLQ